MITVIICTTIQLGKVLDVEPIILDLIVKGVKVFELVVMQSIVFGKNYVFFMPHLGTVDQRLPHFQNL